MSSPRSDSRRSKKRPRDSVPQPAFCDATATVSATQFGARRLPEIKALLLLSSAAAVGSSSSVPVANTAALQSGGRKTSNRHLRRRATSHQPRGNKRRRFLRAARGRNGSKIGDDDDSKKIGNENGEPQSRKACRQKAGYLQSKHETWRHASAFSSHPLEEEDGEQHGQPQSSSNLTITTTPSKPLLPQSAHHWMTTHVWHAKRFRMQVLWDWSVPVLHSGRGCDAALRLAREGKCLVQDVTWRSQPLWFQVPVKALASFAREIARSIPDFASTSLSRVVASSSPSVDTPLPLSGEGVLHQTDCFPHGAVGPVTWICAHRPLLLGNNQRETDAENRDSVFVYLFAHPSIRQATLSCLRSIFSKSTIGIRGPVSGIDGGIACFQLRGSSTSVCLEKALVSTFGPERIDPSLCAFIRDDDDETAAHQHDSVFTPPSSDDQFSLPLWLRRVRRPRDTTTNNNLRRQTNCAACGVDVICSPDQAKAIFHSLILAGACPVGMTEEAFLALECDPPLPIFPRDYPDTDEGTKYWQSSSTSSSSQEWMYVRKHWEGGGGRIRMKCEEPMPRSVSWTDIVVPNNTNTNTSTNNDESQSTNTTADPAVTDTIVVVVVRGPFGDPFRDSLARIGCLPPAMVFIIEYQHCESPPPPQPTSRGYPLLLPSATSIRLGLWRSSRRLPVTFEGARSPRSVDRPRPSLGKRAALAGIPRVFCTTK